MNQDQYDFIQQKYGNLIYMIAQRISGDAATADFEDNVQDLWIAAMESVKWFESQDGGKNGKFEDFKDTKGFDQYIKTCLWHRKGKKGTNITKKLHINNAYSIDGDNSVNEDGLLLEIPDAKVTNYVYNSDVLENISIKLSSPHKRVVSHILQHPDCLKDNGTVNVIEVTKATKLSSDVVQAALRDIKNQYNLSMF